MEEFVTMGECSAAASTCCLHRYQTCGPGREKLSCPASSLALGTLPLAVRLACPALPTPPPCLPPCPGDADEPIVRQFASGSLEGPIRYE